MNRPRNHSQRTSLASGLYQLPTRWAAFFGSLFLGGLAHTAAAPDNTTQSAAAPATVTSWVSSEDLKQQLSPQPNLALGPTRRSAGSSIRIDDSVRHQSILGLGSSLEHSTCYNLSLLPPETRETVLERVVHPDRGIGMNLMRICIGTSDFAPGPFYTYNDLPPGEEDPRLQKFSIERDRDYVLPAIRIAQRLNPQLRFFASPWTPPPWMKTNRKYGGGFLRRECHPYFAEYLVRFIEAYRAEGIPIHALTIQNEPEFGPEPYPSCLWTAEQQRDFIRDHLGPLFRSRGIQTLIWGFDHNFDNPGFPATLFRDPAAAQYVEGAAFHHYVGKPSGMLTLHREFPQKSIYFTEGSVFGVVGALQMISFFENRAQSYNAWVTMIDHRGKPNVSGFHDCSPTIVVLNRDTLQTEYRSDYFLYGQFMRFIQRGAVRVESVARRSRGFGQVAFLNPDGQVVLVVANASPRDSTFLVNYRDQQFEATLPPRSVGTYLWRRGP
ncbi:MAG: glycosyl hydrolase [Verrucomicrobia bacterium]|nr:glycosyl hydrolase [Verrucomicrobiota bacterium]